MPPRPVVPRRPADTLAFADLALCAGVAGGGVALAALLVGKGEAGLAAAPAAFGGWLAGAALLPRAYPHRYRVLGFAPHAATAATAAAVAGALAGWPAWLVGGFALLHGLAVGAVLRYRDHFRARPGRFALAALLGAGLAAAAVWLFAARGGADPAWRRGYEWGLVGATGLLAVVAWLGFARPGWEMALDPVMRAMYRFRGAGARGAVPKDGPCLVIANHAAWFDPLFVAEAVHRETAPLMTAGFYDLPVLAWFMRKVFRVIRVPEQAARRDAPEVKEAVAALDAGQCVVIFPEGYLRRKEECLLRRFGQGVWQVLRDRPGTPVVACWIEGTWGSYFSHKGGPPTKNKRRDLRRPVHVGVSEPVVVPAAVLADHLQTRVWLMNRVLAARTHLGLDPGPPVELPARGAAADDAGADE